MCRHGQHRVRVNDISSDDFLFQGELRQGSALRVSGLIIVLPAPFREIRSGCPELIYAYDFELVSYLSTWNRGQKFGEEQLVRKVESKC